MRRCKDAGTRGRNPEHKETQKSAATTRGHEDAGRARQKPGMLKNKIDVRRCEDTRPQIATKNKHADGWTRGREAKTWKK